MARKSTKKAKGKKKTVKKPTLLSGGNPQIAKGDGVAPVRAYIAAIPGWKRDAARRLDALIERAVPNVRKCVRWNSPFYGVEGRGWFLSFHCFARYIKVTFIRGTSLRPLPPVASKDPETRYVHIQEAEELDERQLAKWVRQAAALPGWDFGSELRTLATNNDATRRQAATSRKRSVPRKGERSETPSSVSKMIDQRIRDLGDWRGAVLKRMRELIHEADPDVVEEWKWKKASSPGTPVWSHDGGICTGESYKQVVKLTFFHGASLEDPTHLFNSSLEGNTRRALDIHEGDAIKAGAFKALIRAAVAFNTAKRKS
jgi:hypothetical protein